MMLCPNRLCPINVIIEIPSHDTGDSYDDSQTANDPGNSEPNSHPTAAIPGFTRTLVLIIDIMYIFSDFAVGQSPPVFTAQIVSIIVVYEGKHIDSAWNHAGEKLSS